MIRYIFDSNGTITDIHNVAVPFSGGSDSGSGGKDNYTDAAETFYHALSEEEHARFLAYCAHPTQELLVLEPVSLPDTAYVLVYAQAPNRIAADSIADFSALYTMTSPLMASFPDTVSHLITACLPSSKDRKAGEPPLLCDMLLTLERLCSLWQAENPAFQYQLHFSPSTVSQSYAAGNDACTTLPLPLLTELFLLFSQILQSLSANNTVIYTVERFGSRLQWQMEITPAAMPDSFAEESIATLRAVCPGFSAPLLYLTFLLHTASLRAVWQCRLEKMRITVFLPTGDWDVPELKHNDPLENLDALYTTSRSALHQLFL